MRKIELSSDITLVEQDPTYRTIIVINETGSYKFRIFLPYMNYILKTWANSLKTLHVTMRSKPLDFSKDIAEQDFFMPPLPNIFAKWAIACIKPDATLFWNSPFNYESNGRTWLGTHLMNNFFYRLENFTMMSPDECMRKYDNWPKETFGHYQCGGIFFSTTPPNNTIPICFKLNDLFQRLPGACTLFGCPIQYVNKKSIL